MLLAVPTEEDMDKISEGDKLMEELNDKVKRLNQDSDVLDVIIKNEEEIIINSLYELGVKNGLSQEREKIVRNLLDRHMSVEDII